MPPIACAGPGMTDRVALHLQAGVDDGLLRAIANADGLERVGCFGADAAHAAVCKEALRRHGYRGAVERIAANRPQDIEPYGTLAYAGIDLARLAWRRLGLGDERKDGARHYSLCGSARTLASHAAMEAVAGLPVAPLRGWDALVCPSRAVRDGVRAILERQAEYLAARLGATRFDLPQLPLIPPGVHAGAFRAGDERRRAARKRFGLAPDDVAVLHVGACAQQMLAALECADKGGRAVRLLACNAAGDRNADPGAAQALMAAAALLAPSIRVTVVDERTGDDADTADTADTAGVADIWAAADIFTSLDDDVGEGVETTVLEAMAAGLPCVVSDWGGHRDAVRDGVDGYRIPTLMPGAGAGLDLAQRYDDGVDDAAHYRGHIGQAVAVDGAALAHAYGCLIRDADVRRELGEHASRRALREFDWSTVLASHRRLWSELEERRRADPDLTAAPAPTVPDRLDPFVLFASHASVQITPASLVELAPDASLALLRTYRDLAIDRMGHASLPTLEAFGQIFGSIGSRPTQVDELLDTLGPCDRSTLLRGLTWLRKMDLVRIDTDDKET